MTADQFMAWYDQQPEGWRYELLDGRVHEMQGETVSHARVKASAYLAFRRAVADRSLPCEAFMDGMAVHVDEETIFEPDAFVRCCAPVNDEATLVGNPVIVVEFASPSTQRIDATLKPTRYIRNPHIAHYLIVIPSTRQIVHHRRGEGAGIETIIHRTGPIPFDPPGLEVTVEEIFGPAPA